MALVKYNNNSISAITTAGQLASGAMTLIKSQTASSSANVSFIHGTSDVVLDSTYPIYVFKFIDIHPATDNVNFTVGFRDGSTDFDAVKQTTAFFGNGVESDSGQQLASSAGSDLAQGTGYQRITDTVGNDNDSSCCGTLFLFSPSSTTHITHFISRLNLMWSGDGPIDWFVQGYCDVTTAIDGVDFKFSSGNIDAGTIKLYGIKDS